MSSACARHRLSSIVAAEYAATRGILIADTKFEFGFIDGELTSLMSVYA